MSDAKKELFLNPVPVMALVYLRRSRGRVKVSDVQKRADTTQAHTSKVVNKLQEKELVTKTKRGREKHLELTDKGKEYADVFNNLLNLINGTNGLAAA